MVCREAVLLHKSRTIIEGIVEREHESWAVVQPIVSVYDTICMLLAKTKYVMKDKYNISSSYQLEGDCVCMLIWRG